VAQGRSSSYSPKPADHHWPKGYVQAVKETPFDPSDSLWFRGP
jgi:hypothetical protein